MPTRSEIQDTLAASQEQVLAYFDGLSPQNLERPCTASGVPGESPWRAKDHYAHLTANERDIQILLRLSLTAVSLPHISCPTSRGAIVLLIKNWSNTYLHFPHS